MHENQHAQGKAMSHDDAGYLRGTGRQRDVPGHQRVIGHQQSVVAPHDVQAVQSAITEINAAITGSVDSSVLAQAQYSTDASNYRVPPAFVVFPRSRDDVVSTLRICRKYQIPITSRGGGTSVAGNSIGAGAVIDFSRHMNRIVEIDPATRTALVEPGVVMSDLQREAAKYGLRFGPDPSTQNRATMGGMIGNNACGPHAVAWGRTADNVVELDCIDGQGREFTASERGLDASPELKTLISENLAHIRHNFGQFSRQVSGYSLEHLLPENGENLAKMLVGSEGTLVTILKARLRLVPLAQAPMLVVLGYPDMPTAADHVPDLLKHKPLAIEGIDAQLVDVVRRAKGSVPDLPAGGGWLLIEVGAEEGDDAAAVPARAAALAADAGTDAVRILPAGAQASELWRIRADGAGLGGCTPSGSQAWPGWEDSAVPPEHLGEYLRQLQALMESYQLSGLMYGHFGDGCMHVRIDFPLDEQSGVQVFRGFMEEAADLVARFGGSLSGEHGDGRARSELLPRMFDPHSVELFSQVKGIFDPENFLNPGVLVDPVPFDKNLRRPAAHKMDYAGGFHFHDDAGNFTNALHRCTGVGNCRADRTAAGFFMCPSYLATREEKDATRGRMRVLQEVANGTLVTGFADSAVAGALDLCLACKACSADCPTGVDMARYRSEVLFRRYRRKIRPRTHYVLGNLPTLARLATSIPGASRLANKLMSIGFIKKAAFTVVGIDARRSMPGFAATRFSTIASKLIDSGTHVGEFGRMAHTGVVPQENAKYVMLWADSFSETLDTRGAQAQVRLLQRMGYTVLIPPRDLCCGLTWITTGQLGTAKKKLYMLLEVLAPFAASGIPIVGVEPSCTAVLRDDVLDLLPDDARAGLVSAMTFTLAELLTHVDYGIGEQEKLPDLRGVEVVAQPHCHHYSVMGWAADAKLLRDCGAELTILSGCCGLAGNFGMEQGHYEISAKIAENSLLPKLRAARKDAVFLADGFSCRTQAQQLAGANGVHLAELLLRGKDVRRRAD
ncbi:FAD/FMN-containing dehydrogenase/Fe-S oxidoreductase [Arcanobacterium pluranimalium]|uniref:FAD-binding and (Fe-S)-binding domain-containing protein n=1 Tax=Arcanobacterium pluranimalium TaxID=108028 RepID=UPI001EF7E353|nr:FAD-binding and (Fe-S)-binding domain-containing protein [Arcanobacterium pluranimalium]MBM7824177.1 FAD/FMN-containing dehydrogenase/Fe-S oxidoreductase [Arcanobacterium pluranimalium]